MFGKFLRILVKLDGTDISNIQSIHVHEYTIFIMFGDLKCEYCTLHAYRQIIRLHILMQAKLCRHFTIVTL